MAGRPVDRRGRRRDLLGALGSGVLLSAMPMRSRSQAVTDTGMLSGLRGTEREKRLADGARREGQVNLYTSLTTEDMLPLNGAFEKRFGLKVNLWRAASDRVLQRVTTEARAGRFDVDVIETNAMPLESLQRENLLQPMRSPAFAHLIDGAVPAHGSWAASRLNVFVQAYNTQRVKEAELPKRLEDLLEPRWKGKLGIEATDDDWFAMQIQQRGEAAGLQLFRDLARGNGLSVRKGHTLLTNLVASGEVPYALTVYNFTAEQLRQRGAPIAWHVLPPAVARANGVAVPRRAPHPHAALLYADFMLGEEAQKILVRRDFVATSRNVQSRLGNVPITVVDAGKLLDDGEKWTRLYEETVVRNSH